MLTTQSWLFAQLPVCILHPAPTSKHTEASRVAILWPYLVWFYDLLLWLPCKNRMALSFLPFELLFPTSSRTAHSHSRIPHANTTTTKSPNEERSQGRDDCSGRWSRRQPGRWHLHLWRVPLSKTPPPALSAGCPVSIIPTCLVLFKQLSNCSEKEGRKGGREAWSDSRKEQSRLRDKGKEKNASALNAN